MEELFQCRILGLRNQCISPVLQISCEYDKILKLRSKIRSSFLWFLLFCLWEKLNSRCCLDCKGWAKTKCINTFGHISTHSCLHNIHLDAQMHGHTGVYIDMVTPLHAHESVQVQNLLWQIFTIVMKIQMIIWDNKCFHTMHMFWHRMK